MPVESGRMQADTIALRVYKQLRHDIIHGVFPPGTRLVKRAVAKRYGVSVPPVIEACLRLENDGLVESSPLVGAYVPQLNPDRIAEERILREAIECQIARQFAVCSSEQDRERVMDLGRDLDRFETREDLGDLETHRTFQKMHSEFHVTLAKLCRVKLLYQQVRKVWFWRSMFVWNVQQKYYPVPDDWHTRLAGALGSGNPERAEVAMREHLTRNVDKKIESIPKSFRQGDEFIEGIISQASVPEYLLSEDE